ncbi:MAG: prephenate dehydrogenase/arogenate dehydrogenase family protein [Candidatus Schekmanbacteria bacterium]|nr:prephenate dehydrogenase/arogenate dehydrogenase family protein [Candidatus Schekmanbacteria bacterium]
MTGQEREPAEFQRVAIVGLGLMGGSLASALRHAATPPAYLLGVDPDQETRELALKYRLVDEVSPAPDARLATCDLIVLAAPIGTILELLPIVMPRAGAGAVITDIGSTKAEVVTRALELAQPDVHFVGGHPMTGAEKQGIRHFNPYLYENAIYVLTPATVPPAPEEALAVERLSRWIRNLGGRVLILDASQHDEAAAAVSHVPHLLAVALTLATRRLDEAGTPCAPLAAGGFRDMTRVAGSPSRMWQDIYASNLPRIRTVLRAFSQALSEIEAALVDPEAINRFLDEASSFRRRIPEKTKGFLDDLVYVLVVVEDRPGVIAGISGALVARGISIRDIEVLKIREGRGGTLMLGFRDRDDAERASMTIRAIGYDCWIQS